MGKKVKIASIGIRLMIFVLSLLFFTSFATACLTIQQVSSERTKCLYVYNNKVYHKGYYGDSHQGHPCGTDITSVMEKSHIIDPRFYLWPLYHDDLCECEGDCSEGRCGQPDGCGGVCSSADANNCGECGNPGCVDACVPDCSKGNCGQDDGCGGVCPNYDINSCGRCENPGCKGTCIPNCLGDRCGQDDGCGKTCPDNDIDTCGKCGNEPCCQPTCEGEQCGQADGCLGICPEFDKNTCGLCGNEPCCRPFEICGNSKDDDCDGLIDEECPSKTKLIWQQTKDKVQKKIVPISVRASGLVALLLFIVSGMVGISRMSLIKRYSRKEVIRYHTYLALVAFAFMVVHMALLLLHETWTRLLDINSLFVPDFSNSRMTAIAFGVIAMYIVSIDVFSGYLYVKMVKHFGYKVWLRIHQTSFLAVALVAVHGLQIGSDAKNILVIVVFSVLLLLMGFQIYHRASSKKNAIAKAKLDAAKRANEKQKNSPSATPSKSLQPQHTKIFSIKEIKHDKSFLGKDIELVCYIQPVTQQMLAQGTWYMALDQTDSMLIYAQPGINPSKARITGTIKIYGSSLYLMLKEIKPIQ